ncbi:mediator of RNA polymerase II transcription subunit 34 isoform X1 [Tanacetum coccineum]
MTLQDRTWHMDTGASSHLNSNASNLSTIFDKRLFSSVHIGHAKAIVSLLQEIQEMDQRVTMLQLVEKFKVKNKKVGFELKDELEQLVIHLILDRVLKEEFLHTAYATNAYVTTGPLAKHVLHGKKNITLEATSGHKSSTSVAKSSKRSRYSGLEVELDN